MSIKGRLNGQFFPLVLTALLAVIGFLATQMYYDLKSDLSAIKSQVDVNHEAIQDGYVDKMQHLGDHNMLEKRVDDLEEGT